MNRLKDIFPSPNELVSMEPEEIGPFLLEYLNALEDNPTSSRLNRYNLTLDTNQDLRDYAGGDIVRVARVITEGWVWLEKECLIAPSPGDQGEWVFITRKGKRLKNHTDFSNYNSSSMLDEDALDPVLLQKVKPLFIRGDLDTAVFQAFKEVEVRIRKAGGYGNDVIGVDLARKAFHPETGPLTDKGAVASERDSFMHLYSGALGVFKNPGSHRDVEIDNPAEGVELIYFANYLLRVVDSRINAASN